MGVQNEVEAEVQSLTQGWVEGIRRDSEARLKAREALEQSIFPFGRKAPSSRFDWHVGVAEMFTYFHSRYDVTAAKRIILEKPRVTALIRVEEAAPLLPDMPDESVRRTLDFSIDIDWTRVEVGTGIDLSIPIVIAAAGRTRIPIDGWHRIARARYLWARELPCVLLTSAETDRILL